VLAFNSKLSLKKCAQTSRRAHYVAFLLDRKYIVEKTEITQASCGLIGLRCVIVARIASSSSRSLGLNMLISLESLRAVLPKHSEGSRNSKIFTSTELNLSPYVWTRPNTCICISACRIQRYTSRSRPPRPAARTARKPRVTLAMRKCATESPRYI